MKKATKIRMKPSFYEGLSEIDSIYIEGDGYDGLYKKSDLYDKITFNNWSVIVDIIPFPQIKGAISVNGEKYVKSEPDETGKDNLLKLPRI